MILGHYRSHKILATQIQCSTCTDQASHFTHRYTFISKLLSTQQPVL